jgi:hypothetical protein
MTNLMTVTIEAVLNDVFTEDEAVNYLVTTGALPLYTFQEWKKRGYYVKRGEKARLICNLWKHNAPKTKTDENGREVTIIPKRAFNGVKAFLFTPDQVAPLTH